MSASTPARRTEVLFERDDFTRRRVQQLHSHQPCLLVNASSGSTSRSAPAGVSSLPNGAIMKSFIRAWMSLAGCDARDASPFPPSRSCTAAARVRAGGVEAATGSAPKARDGPPRAGTAARSSPTVAGVSVPATVASGDQAAQTSSAAAPSQAGGSIGDATTSAASAAGSGGTSPRRLAPPSIRRMCWGFLFAPAPCRFPPLPGPPIGLISVLIPFALRKSRITVTNCGLFPSVLHQHQGGILLKLRPGV
jgi:hypothetical protein